MPAVIMPKMGDGMEEGTLLRWLKQEGDAIAVDDVIAEIETDKATVELPAETAGTLTRRIVAEGAVVPVGEPIAVILAAGETLAGDQTYRNGHAGPELREVSVREHVESTGTRVEPPQPTGTPLTIVPPPDPPAAAPSAGDAAPGDRLRASPFVRRLAQEHTLDLSQIQGSGPGGRVVRRDLDAILSGRSAVAVAEPVAIVVPAPAAPPPAPTTAPPQPTRSDTASADDTLEPLTRMRQAIARRMATAKREMPHYYVAVSVDMTEAIRMRRELNAQLPEADHIPISPMIVKACALALEAHPHFNATFTDSGITVHHTINIGLAVALEDGLVVPAILDCRGKSLGAISRASRDVAERARNGRLKPAELNDGTFTVSNLGMYGVETLVAIIQPGQAAILGVGNVEERAVVREGQVVARSIMTIALSADHRVTDGAEGAQFIAAIKRLLENPARLVL
jgi:pyruvate dehydrogenase E2 component (dihydrolipoamide acetyltransferase)